MNGKSSELSYVHRWSKAIIAKDASSYRGYIEHYRARLVQDNVDLDRYGFTHCAAIQG